MRKIMLACCGLMVVFMISACSSAPLPPPNYTFEEDAIIVNVTADPNLNRRDGKPHTLLICLYQLRDPNTFNQLSGDEAGLYRLLACSLFDGSVASARKLIIQPGEEKEIVLDRAQGASYVAVAAGYYLMQKEGMLRLYDVPIIVKRVSLFSSSKIQLPETLTISLKLGPENIE